MADEDNFDIDIYGDGEGMDEDSKEFYKQENQKSMALREQHQQEQVKSEQQTDTQRSASSNAGPEQVESASHDSKDDIDVKLKPQQGIKRKGDSDERRIDPGATNALMISDLHWWTTEDDIRDWASEADAEDELRDITFSEHKVNGKSKGQAFVEFVSPQASTATKRRIESLSGGPNNARKFAVVFANASSNPFKTLPKDAPARGKDERAQRSTSSSYSAPTHHNYNQNNTFRGGRGGGFNNRGGYNQGYHHNNNINNNNNNSNRNFSGPSSIGGFNSGSGFGGNMPMMNNFNSFGGRGGMAGNTMRGNMGGMRGGRGGMNSGMMPMGMMGMGMGMGMGMNPGMTGMGPQGFGGAGPQFNPNMFNQGGNPGMNSGDWGHGQKRQRQD